MTTAKRHHYVWPAESENGPRDLFEWHDGLRINCAVCLNDNNGNRPPHPIKLHNGMQLRQRMETRNAESQGIPGTHNGGSKESRPSKARKATRSNSASRTPTQKGSA